MIYKCITILLLIKHFLCLLDFECFTRTYVDALQKNSSLTFEKAFEQASKFHNSKLVVKLVHEFEFELQKISLPVKSKQALNEECFGYMNRVLKVYRNQAYPYKSEFFESKAVSKMKKISEHKLEENRTVVQKVLLDALEKQHNKIIIANQDQFDRKEGSELYRQCIDHLKLEFQNDMKEYDQDELITAIVNFKLRIKDEKMRIGFQARMHEERERSEQLRKEVQETLKSHFESKLEDIEAERLKEMKKEMKEFQRNLTERKGLETVKGMSFFKRFKLLFR
ncbi:structural maintenance of chromosomes protein 2-like [Mercenaria mercenaria]|uniref:structural maintenance of chromosomes protein 2-like n=1 Tax=Mercenaria mercenaria TaxID=6596 RepID=UPI00234EE161|nr:structural maintenance of chromosomes protein 2-like [Mercenaria mercenaria]